MVLTEGSNCDMVGMHGIDVVKGHIVYSSKIPKGSEVDNDEPFREPVVSVERRPPKMESASNVGREYIDQMRLQVTHGG